MDSFLIQLDGANFLTTIHDGQPFGSPYPTYGQRLSYDAADQLSRKLQNQGYTGATVVDRFGQPPTAADLATVKRSVDYQVTFHGRYFCGQNASKQDLGSTDRRDAINMSQPAAVIVCQRLKKMGFLDAAVLETSSPTVDVNEELNRIWPEEFAAKK
jgi:hypothetical protein